MSFERATQEDILEFRDGDEVGVREYFGFGVRLSVKSPNLQASGQELLQ